MIGIGIISNIPGDDGQKIANSMAEEFHSLCASIQAVHGEEFANFVVPLATVMMNITQTLSLTVENTEHSKDFHKLMFIAALPRAYAHQMLELVANRAEAFVKHNPEHKTIKSVKDFVRIYQETSDMLLKKLGEYMEGKKV